MTSHSLDEVVREEVMETEGDRNVSVSKGVITSLPTSTLDRILGSVESMTRKMQSLEERQERDRQRQEQN